VLVGVGVGSGVSVGTDVDVGVGSAGVRLHEVSRTSIARAARVKTRSDFMFPPNGF
jgi:hypothetical protein